MRMEIIFISFGEIRGKSTSVDDIKLFNVDGYSFDNSLSDDSQLVFTR